MHCTEFVPFIAVLGVLGVLCWEKIRKEPLLSGLIGALGLLFVVFVAVLVFECVEADILKLLGLEKDEKNEALKFLGIGMGGAVLALQAVIANKRAQAMGEAADAQARAADAQASATKEQAKANENTERGQRQERMKNAIEHLGHSSDSVRLGGAYELFHLADDEDTAENKKDLRQTVLDILCAHIRRTTREPGYRKDYNRKPSEEIQSLLTLLFVQEYEVFTGLDIKLQGSCLNGSNLYKARLEKAHLFEAQLHGAHLREAQLHGADLWRAQLHEADLMQAQLHGAYLRQAQLHGAYLRQAGHGAYLMQAQLQGAYLWEAQLYGADLTEAQLQGAYLMQAQLHEADLTEAQLHGASSNDLRSPDEPFEAVINERIDKKSELTWVIFAGGLTPEDVASIGTGLLDEAAKKLRKRLEAHIGDAGSRVFGLPENSGADQGKYTKEEADQWIAEYKTVVSRGDG